eukprot:52974_1
MTNQDKKNFLRCEFVNLDGTETMADVSNYRIMKFSQIKEVAIMTPFNQKRCCLYVKFPETKSFVLYKRFKLKKKFGDQDKIEHFLQSLIHYPSVIKDSKRFFDEIGVDCIFDSKEIETIKTSSLVVHSTVLGKKVTVLHRLVNEFQ